MSHSKIGWAEFTDTVIKKVSELKKNVVFLVWGKFAQEKRILIDETKTFDTESGPSFSLSVHAGFFWLPAFFKSK